MIPDWAVERQQMVERQLRKRAIRDHGVLRAMGGIPREEFVSPESRILTYTDDPLPIGCGQTISQPYMTALMAQVLELRGVETVLEVGAGCGYAAAVLATISRHVVAVEIIPALAALAERNLARTGYGANVTVVCADGTGGWPERAPYDAISVAAGAPDIPVKLLEQLADPGRMVIPVGDRGEQELLVVTKEQGRIEQHVATYCRFVPLRGQEGWG